MKITIVTILLAVILFLISIGIAGEVTVYVDPQALNDKEWKDERGKIEGNWAHVMGLGRFVRIDGKDGKTYIIPIEKVLMIQKKN